ncbi:MAG: hypothetical protein QUS14_11965 [Pyrinomonadaceae bacterium]|nr:hypothetical protein [Pyrinomonadaceae bacterium]
MKIEFDDQNIRLIKDGQVAPISWGMIESVFAYKQDHVIVDRVVTLIKMDGGLEIEVDEEMEGWKELVDAMPKHLPNCRDFSDWYMEVAFPAFEPNPTLIYRRLNADQIH